MIDHPRRSILLAATGLLFSSCSDDPAPLDWTRGPSAPVVVGFDRFHRSAAAADGGRLLLGDLGCTHCHAATPAQLARLSPKEAPRLGAVGRRMHHDAFARRIAAPRVEKPGTTMPDVWHGVPAAVREAEVEALTHWLTSLSPGGINPVHTDEAAARRGGELYRDVGCAACHDPGFDSGLEAAHSVPLPSMANTYGHEAIARFLERPHDLRPSGRMPALLNHRESEDVAHYLLRGTRTEGALRYERFDVPLEGLPELDMESPAAAKTGVTDAFDLKVATRRHDFVLRFSGFVRVDTAGEHTFHLRSDDGSRLKLDGEQQAEIAGKARDKVVRETSAAVTLSEGWHELVVEYFQRGGEAVLEIEWEGPGFERSAVPTSALRHTMDDIAPYAPLVPDPELVHRGEAVFAARGCANCHRDPQRGPGVVAAALTDVDPDRGCLAEELPPAAPDFGLDHAQRYALREAVRELADVGGAPEPERVIDHSMKTWNCVACHVRDGVGGVLEDRDAIFTSNGEDLGDEGRIPPDLTGVGDRLQHGWLHGVLTEGRPVRPYLETRMPRFGDENVGHLTSAFVSVDRPPERSRTAEAEDTRAIGRDLVGENALACILCHDFNRRAAQTMSVVDLASTTERLRRDWFDRYMINPEEYHPGTRMPSFWPLEVSVQRDVLGGNARRQIDSIWAYLSDGERARDPEGLDRKGVELIVGGDAIVYRGKLWEAGWRGIAVGFPERVNVAYDAEQPRLSLLWKERFLDVTAHWTRQGSGRIRPHGTDVVVLPHGSPFAVLADLDAPWPTAGPREDALRFRGYDLDERSRPTFRYSFDEIDVEDAPRPHEVAGIIGIERTLTFTSGEPVRDLWMRVAAGKEITPTDDGGFRVDDRITLRLVGERERSPRVRSTPDGAELLFPVDVAAGANEMIVRYAW